MNRGAARMRMTLIGAVLTLIASMTLSGQRFPTQEPGHCLQEPDLRVLRQVGGSPTIQEF